MRRATRIIQAAGAVVFRRGGEVLLVHRPKYDDWSFPKGKLDRGELAPTAAVREVDEETGMRIRLHRPLGPQRYPVKGGRKLVHYWTGRLLDPSDDDVSNHCREGEIDRVAWVPIDVALKQLTYRHDRATLREAMVARKRTSTVIVLRHGEAWARNGWHGEDHRRPLVAAGRKQADALSHVLAAYGVTRVVSSSSTRCIQTIAPYAEAAGVVPEATEVLSEEAATRAGVRELVRALRREASADDRGPTVICSHRTVLPMIEAALKLEDLTLEKGEFLVLHLRKGRVRATERYQA